MKRFAILILAVAIALTGCAENAPPVLPAKKEALRKFLDPKFLLTSVPPKKEEALYQILEVFAESRRPDEFVRDVDFSSSSEAELSFSDGGMHGGGHATMKKKSGKWTLHQKFYFM